jgi:hypothetical protein
MNFDKDLCLWILARMTRIWFLTRTNPCQYKDMRCLQNLICYRNLSVIIFNYEATLIDASFFLILGLAWYFLGNYLKDVIRVGKASNVFFAENWNPKIWSILNFSQIFLILWLANQFFPFSSSIKCYFWRLEKRLK